MKKYFMNYTDNNDSSKDSMAHTLFGPQTEQKPDDPKEREALINALGDDYEPKHSFSTNENLRKLVEEKRKKNTAFVDKTESNQNPEILKGHTEFNDKYSYRINGLRALEKERSLRKNETDNSKEVKKEFKPEEIVVNPEAFSEKIKRQNEETKKLRKEGEFEKEVQIYDFVLKAGNSRGLNRAASLAVGSDSVNMYNLSEEPNNLRSKLYLKDAVNLTNVNDKEMSNFNNGELKQFQSYIETKIGEQFKDFGYKKDEVPGHIFKSNSDPVKRIKQNDDFKAAIAQNLHNISDGKRFSMRFKNLGGRASNMHYAFASVDFLNAGFDKDGNLKLYMFDTYDFNKGENAMVEAGRRDMLKGHLKPFYTLHEISLSPKELDVIIQEGTQQKWK